MVLQVTNHHRTCSTVLVSGACSWMVDMVSLYSEQNPHDTDTERTGLMRRSMFLHWFYADPRENNLSGNRKHGDILRLNVSVYRDRIVGFLQYLNVPSQVRQHSLVMP